MLYCQHPFISVIHIPFHILSCFNQVLLFLIGIQEYKPNLLQISFMHKSAKIDVNSIKPPSCQCH